MNPHQLPPFNSYGAPAPYPQPVQSNARGFITTNGVTFCQTQPPQLRPPNTSLINRAISIPPTAHPHQIMMVPPNRQPHPTFMPVPQNGTNWQPPPTHPVILPFQEKAPDTTLLTTAGSSSTISRDNSSYQAIEPEQSQELHLAKLNTSKTTLNPNAVEFSPGKSAHPPASGSDNIHTLQKTPDKSLPDLIPPSAQQRLPGLAVSNLQPNCTEPETEGLTDNASKPDNQPTPDILPLPVSQSAQITAAQILNPKPILKAKMDRDMALLFGDKIINELTSHKKEKLTMYEKINLAQQLSTLSKHSHQETARLMKERNKILESLARGIKKTDEYCFIKEKFIQPIKAMGQLGTQAIALTAEITPEYIITVSLMLHFKSSPRSLPARGHLSPFCVPFTSAETHCLDIKIPKKKPGANHLLANFIVNGSKDFLELNCCIIKLLTKTFPTKLAALANDTSTPGSCTIKDIDTHIKFIAMQALISRLYYQSTTKAPDVVFLFLEVFKNILTHIGSMSLYRDKYPEQYLSLIRTLLAFTRENSDDTAREAQDNSPWSNPNIAPGLAKNIISINVCRLVCIAEAFRFSLTDNANFPYAQALLELCAEESLVTHLQYLHAKDWSPTEKAVTAGRLHKMHDRSTYIENKKESAAINSLSISAKISSEAGSYEKTIKKNDSVSDATTLAVSDIACSMCRLIRAINNLEEMKKKELRPHSYKCLLQELEIRWLPLFTKATIKLAGANISGIDKVNHPENMLALLDALKKDQASLYKKSDAIQAAIDDISHELTPLINFVKNENKEIDKKKKNKIEGDLHRIEREVDNILKEMGVFKTLTEQLAPLDQTNRKDWERHKTKAHSRHEATHQNSSAEATTGKVEARQTETTEDPDKQEVSSANKNPPPEPAPSSSAESQLSQVTTKFKTILNELKSGERFKNSEIATTEAQISAAIPEIKEDEGIRFWVYTDLSIALLARENKRIALMCSKIKTLNRLHVKTINKSQLLPSKTPATPKAAFNWLDEHLPGDELNFTSFTLLMSTTKQQAKNDCFEWAETILQLIDKSNSYGQSMLNRPAQRDSTGHDIEPALCFTSEQLVSHLEMLKKTSSIAGNYYKALKPTLPKQALADSRKELLNRLGLGPDNSTNRQHVATKAPNQRVQQLIKCLEEDQKYLASTQAKASQNTELDSEQIVKDIDQLIAQAKALNTVPPQEAILGQPPGGENRQLMDQHNQAST